ncbi:MAG: general secretion pathway protein GspN [Lysobacter sp.]|nr:general secretion pathway protein GspN [Lysobacter sp.]MDQ3270470.1 general secretion pathway protein GspN [Pseudomonadota bacterium]
MRIDDAGPRTWLLAGIALWALLGWLLAIAGMGGRVEPLPPDPGLLQPLPQVRTAPPPRLGSLAQYSEVANRPLFAVDRRPQPFAMPGTGEAEPAAAAFDYVLTGVLLTPNFRMATLQPPDGSDTVRVRVGEAPEALRSWTLVELGERSAVFEGPTGRQTVHLRTYDGIGGAPPTVVSQAPRGSDDPGRPGQSSQRPVQTANGGGEPTPTAQSAPSPVPAPPSSDPAPTFREPPPRPGQSQTGPQPANDQAQMEAIRKRIQERRRKLRADSPTPPQRP